jgi:hypothetical protein
MGYARCAGPIVFLAALWLALGRCSTPDWPGLRGLLFITAHMSTGVGGFSMIFAIPAVMAHTIHSGDRDSAFAWLERARNEHAGDLLYVRAANPEMKSLHSDPRWAVFLRKMNLPAEGS